MDSSSEHLLHVADALYEKGEAPKCAVSLSARSDAAANCRADNVTYTRLLSMMGWAMCCSPNVGASPLPSSNNTQTA